LEVYFRTRASRSLSLT